MYLITNIVCFLVVILSLFCFDSSHRTYAGAYTGSLGFFSFCGGVWPKRQRVHSISIKTNCFQKSTSISLIRSQYVDSFAYFSILNEYFTKPKINSSVSRCHSVSETSQTYLLFVETPEWSKALKTQIEMEGKRISFKQFNRGV